MSRDRVYQPLSKGARTDGLGTVLAILASLTALTGVGVWLDREWWITSASVAVLVAVTAAIAIPLARREAGGTTLTVRRDEVVLNRRGQETIVRRDAPGHVAALADVSIGPDSATWRPTLVVTDGVRSIDLNAVTWGDRTLRDVAAALDASELPGVVSRAELLQSVGRPVGLVQRRPGLVGALLVLALVVAVLAVAVLAAFML